MKLLVSYGNRNCFSIALLFYHPDMQSLDNHKVFFSVLQLKLIFLGVCNMFGAYNWRYITSPQIPKILNGELKE